MPTRAFVLDRPKRRFWDISWAGPSVEITSGTWGADGRARNAMFSAERERDAFIAAEIAKIIKKDIGRRSRSRRRPIFPPL